MASGIDRHKGAKKARISGERGDGIHERLDISVLMKQNECILRKKEQLSKLADLLGLPNLPDYLRPKFEEWKKFLLSSNEWGTLERSDGQYLVRKWVRLVRLANQPLPENYVPPKKKFREFRPKPPIAAFFRDPSLLPKKPPGR